MLLSFLVWRKSVSIVTYVCMFGLGKVCNVYMFCSSISNLWINACLSKRGSVCVCVFLFNLLMFMFIHVCVCVCVDVNFGILSYICNWFYFFCGIVKILYHINIDRFSDLQVAVAGMFT